MIVGVRRTNNMRHALAYGGLRHLQGFLDGLRSIVQSKEQVIVNVDHGLRGDPFQLTTHISEGVCCTAMVEDDRTNEKQYAVRPWNYSLVENTDRDLFSDT
jgi:hypothetical protein